MAYSYLTANGDCYFTRECEALGLLLLVTPIPSFKEQGLVNGKNCYYIPFDVEDINIDNIVNNIPSYEGYGKEDKWNTILAKGKSKYNPKENMILAKVLYEFTLEDFDELENYKEQMYLKMQISTYMKEIHLNVMSRCMST